jgi:predicted Zn-ribbon and HTH transcriptional regulator
LEAYKGSKERIKCRCKKCNYVWNPQAASIVKTNPSGCPRCAGTLKLDTKSFTELMKNVNPNIEILGEYVNTETGIKCRCKMCGYEWNPKPHSLKAGHGCPFCSKKDGWKKRRLPDV